ncbi:orotidine-5'-phosphate decarboxylase [Inhella gelatinilytica]|uniref:Orotidine 5'-phosphate decarboxylase n=1 Tax=Inhella gelatinilytica TaxID=2795030 RepID=A0A931IRV0_9BURK|nr:orotidine-5'-phosphate decarboxylase [Inhella gelatinilytica]MBH9551530.1 orotidine-5'-phosphate decarboxylase [Inhella gelatinilytica]
MPTFFDRLQAAIQARDSLLCVGLDPDPAKFPGDWQGDARRIADFCCAVVDATVDLAAAFKPQIAYFAAAAAEDQLQRVIDHIRAKAPDMPIVLDAKRGDIGATATLYAKEAFERYGADAVTLSPYMGFDTIEPYLDYTDRGVFVLCRTSNAGGDDWQMQRLADVDGQPRLFEELARRAQHEWTRIPGQIGLVVGATYPREIERVRELAPTLPLLIPGVGAQGGDAEATVRAGWRAEAPILVNSSRAVLYAGRTVAEVGPAARAVAEATRAQLQAARG